MKRVLVLILALMMLLTACSNAEVVPSSTPEATNSTTSSPRTDVNISGGIVSTLDPHKTTLGTDVQCHAQIYESFFYLDNHAKPYPRLAESYEVSDDGLVYTFNMRKGAKFHNGDEVKASDAVFSIKRAMEITNMAAYVAPIKEVKAIDDYTVQIDLNTVYVPFLINIVQVRIISERAVLEAGEGFGLNEYNNCGSGPYIITAYKPETEIVFEAFKDYYQGEAAIKIIKYNTITDSSTQLIAFQSGELDFLSIPTANWAEIEGTGKYTTLLNPSTSVCYIGLNCYTESSPLYNKKVRQAVQYAIDRDALNNAAYDGIGTPAFYMCNPEFIYATPTDAIVYNYDTKKSKELLAEAGYPNGIDLGTLLCPNSMYYPKVAQVLQALLADVGMTIKIETMESASASARGRTGEFDIYINRNNFVMDYDSFSRNCHSRSLKTQIIKYNSKELDALFDRGAAELDPAKRLEIYKETENWIKDTAAHISTFYSNTPYAWNKNLDAKVDLNYYYVYEWSWK